MVRPEQRHLHAGGLERLEVGPPTQIHANAVKQQPHPHALTRLVRQQGDDFAAQAVAAEHKRADIERIAGAQQHRAQCFERLMAVLVDRQLCVGRSARQAQRTSQLLKTQCW